VLPSATSTGSPLTTLSTIVVTDLNTIGMLRNPVSAKLANGSPPALDALLTAGFAAGSGSRARKAARLVAAHAQRVRIVGALQTPAGRPIVGASVYLVQKPMGASDREWRIDAAALTGGDSTFTLPVQSGGQSREIRVVYFPAGGSDANRASNPLTLQIRQDAKLEVSRRSLRNGGRLVFRGRVLGTILTKGVNIRLQVRLNRSWFTFRRLTTTRSKGGRFQAAHRFTKTTRATTYRFRVVVLPRDRTLNSVGFSRHIDVRVRP